MDCTYGGKKRAVFRRVFFFLSEFNLGCVLEKVILPFWKKPCIK